MRAALKARAACKTSIRSCLSTTTQAQPSLSTAFKNGPCTYQLSIVSYGFVVAYMVTAGGSGYTELPVVTVLGGGGTGATAMALVTNGVVTQIKVVDTGSGYTSPPQVAISAPPVEPTVLTLQLIPLVTIHGLPGDTNRVETSTSLSAGFEPVLPGGSLGSKRRLSRRTFCLAAGGAVCYGQPDERDVDAEFLPGAV